MAFCGTYGKSVSAFIEMASKTHEQHLFQRHSRSVYYMFDAHSLCDCVYVCIFKLKILCNIICNVKNVKCSIFLYQRLLVFFIAHQPRDNKHIICSNMCIWYTWVEFFSLLHLFILRSFFWMWKSSALYYVHPIDRIKHTGQSSCVSHMDRMKRSEKSGNGCRTQKEDE